MMLASRAPSPLRAALFAFIALALVSPVPLPGQEEPSTGSQSEPVFSGPQVGESIPKKLETFGVWDDEGGKEIDAIAAAGERPILLVFVHRVTRPTLGLARIVSDWAVERGDEKLATQIVWLARDRLEAEEFLKRARRSLNLRAPVRIAAGGEEGPGAWGLNRNVGLTIVVAKEGKVTASFALVQPSDTDAPAILRAVADVAGGEPPTLEEIRAQQGAGRMERRGGTESAPDAELATRLRRMIQRDQTEEDAKAAIRAVEEWVGENPERQRQLGALSARIVSGRLYAEGAYGGESARAKLAEWAKRWGADASGGEASTPRRERPRVALLRSLSFFASFDKTADADFSRGDGRVHTTPDGKVENGRPGVHRDDVRIVAHGGRHGGALRFEKKSPAWLYYSAARNVAWSAEEFKGTISLWLRLDPDRDLEPGYCDPFQITGRAWNDASIFVDFTDKPPRDFRLGAFADRKVWDPKEREWDAVPEAERPMVTVKDAPFSREKFTHVVVTYDGFNRKDGDAVARVYLDGELRGELKGHPQIHTWDLRSAALFLGLSYIGDVDELAHFDRALSGDEVKLLFGLEGGLAALTRDRVQGADEREQPEPARRRDEPPAR